VPPFFENDADHLFAKIREGDWKEKCALKIESKTSTHLKDILTRLFEPDPEVRIDATQCVNHPFFKVQNEKYKELSANKVYDLFTNLRHFRAPYMLQKEVLKHMVTRFVAFREKEFIKQVFDALDEEKDGELEPIEFIE